MKTQRIGYLRVSTLDQNPERQLDGQELDITFTDTASGKDMNRPQLQAALKHARLGDTFVVHSMDRLARSVEDMLRLVRELTEKGVRVQFVKENMLIEGGRDDPRSMLLLMIMTSFAQFERALIRERQREGITLAKARGVYKGKKRLLDQTAINRLRERVALGETPKTKIARDFGISRETLYQYIKE